MAGRSAAPRATSFVLNPLVKTARSLHQGAHQCYKYGLSVCVRIECSLSLSAPWSRIPVRRQHLKSEHETTSTLFGPAIRSFKHGGTTGHSSLAKPVKHKLSPHNIDFSRWPMVLRWHEASAGHCALPRASGTARSCNGRLPWLEEDGLSTPRHLQIRAKGLSRKGSPDLWDRGLSKS